MNSSKQPAYREVHGSTRNLADAESFLKIFANLHAQSAEVQSLFNSQNDIFIARAPGRLDVMGGIADYSGSLVLQMPIQQAALVALQKSSVPTIRIVSLGSPENGRSDATFEMPLHVFETAHDYAAARNYFQCQPERTWAAYVAGVFFVLMRERDAKFDGVNILLASQVPEGKGVSSSAAIEVASMQAVCAAFGIRLEQREMAILCQKVENLVVGAPCGVMDQMTSACGEQARFLELLCQPADIRGMVAIPQEIAFWGVDSGVRHSVSGSDYGSVRVGTFMGYRILSDIVGLTVHKNEKDRRVSIDDPRWHGFLANLTPAEFEKYQAQIPEQITGKDFLARYGGTTDSVTRVEPERSYAVRQPTAHPVYENFRVRTFAELLSAPIDEKRLTQLGELMYQSHASYSACGLGSEGTDLLVELARAAGPTQGLYGAKITGGGSGGTVAILGKREAHSAVQDIANAYCKKTGHNPIIFSDSSPGAAAFGFLRLSPQKN